MQDLTVSVMLKRKSLKMESDTIGVAEYSLHVR